jgi:hypothetical protein
VLQWQSLMAALRGVGKQWWASSSSRIGGCVKVTGPPGSAGFLGVWVLGKRSPVVWHSNQTLHCCALFTKCSLRYCEFQQSHPWISAQDEPQAAGWLGGLCGVEGHVLQASLGGPWRLIRHVGLAGLLIQSSHKTAAPEAPAGLEWGS